MCTDPKECLIRTSYFQSVHVFIFIHAFSLEIQGILMSYQSRSVAGLSITFLVIISSPKLLDIAILNFAKVQVR